jgi:hypothetical protein
VYKAAAGVRKLCGHQVRRGEVNVVADVSTGVVREIDSLAQVTGGLSHRFKLERAPVAHRRFFDDASSQANLPIVVRSIGVVEVECNLLEAYSRRAFTKPKEKDGMRLMRMQ